MMWLCKRLSGKQCVGICYITLLLMFGLEAVAVQFYEKDISPFYKVLGGNQKRRIIMSFERVKKYFEGVGLENRITVHDELSDTAQHAAEVIGCEMGQIAKTLTFLQDGKVVLILMSGEAKVDNHKYHVCFDMRSKMVPFEKVEELTGYEPGAVSPYELPDGTTVYLDVSLQRYQTVYTAAGSLNSTIRLTLDELVEYSHSAGWVDVCKGWEQTALVAS